MTNTDLNRQLRAEILATQIREPAVDLVAAPVVAIVAPSGYAASDVAVARGIATLEAQGCSVRNFYDGSRKYQRFAATDDARIAQLYAASQDAEVDIVLALRGGYGLSRLLPSLDFPMLAASGKLFVGHSDFTAFQMGLLAQTGALSFAGPMLCDDFVRENLSALTMQSFWQCITHANHTVAVEVEGNPALECEGTLWGGNLAILTHLVGSPYLPQIDNGILFIEDVNEHPYRVERMVLQLLHAGILERQQALVLGDFSAYTLSDYDNGYDFAQMLAYLRNILPIPVIGGLPFGHTPDKVTLAVGASCQLRSEQTTLRLTMSDYPHLPAR